MIQHGIDEDKFSVVNATVLVKGDGDSVGVLAASDLSIGTRSTAWPTNLCCCQTMS